MQPISFRPTAQKPLPKPRFGAGAVELSGATKVADGLFRSVTGDRTRQMLFEDFVGFGLLRSYMDWRRGDGQGNQNLPAAGERLGRESLSIVTDNVLAGGVAYAVAKGLERGKKGFSNQFIGFRTMDLLQSVAQQEKPASGAAFTKALSERFALSEADSGKRMDIQKALNQAWETGVDLKAKSASATPEQAAALAKALNANAESFNVKLQVGNKQKSFAVNELLDDVTRFSRHMAQAEEGKKGDAWLNTAKDSIAKTIQTKRTRIPLSIAAAMGATFAVPFVISAATRKMFGINSYPGEMAYKKQNPDQADSPQGDKGFFETNFPYLTQSCKNGNFLPLAVTLLPLPVAMGFMDTVKRKGVKLIKREGGQLKFQSDKWLKKFDFQKLAPFTAQQQMASVFALLITSRLMNARSDNEFRERMLDCFAGWGLWIFGTPLMQQASAKLSDKAFGTALLNEKGAMRSREEIQHLLKEGMTLAGKEGKTLSKKALQRTMKANVWLGIGSTAMTMGLLGVAEPLMEAWMTKRNERNKQAKAEQAASANQQPMPSAAMPSQNAALTFSPVASSYSMPFPTQSFSNPAARAFSNPYQPNPYGQQWQ